MTVQQPLTTNKEDDIQADAEEIYQGSVVIGVPALRPGRVARAGGRRVRAAIPEGWC